MKCEKCGCENLENALYCKNCGSEIKNSVENAGGNLDFDPIQDRTKGSSNAQQGNPVVQNVNDSSLEFNDKTAILAIVVSMLCCGNWLALIFAILGLVEGNKVKDFVSRGDNVTARDTLEKANKYIKISFIVMAVLGVLVVLFLAIQVVATFATVAASASYLM